ncbi:MAG: hypothetical protein WDO24_05235 [Pseudomonadota bacterium]
MQRAAIDTAELARLIAAFHRAHKLRYGYDMPDHPIELVTLRLAVLAARANPPSETIGMTAGTLAEARLDSRSVWFAATGFVGTPVYQREKLPAETGFAGPAIVEQMDATTVVPPGWDLRVDPRGNLLLAHNDAPVTTAAAWDMQLSR